MFYTEQIEIDLPRDRVAALFERRDLMGHWQDGLQSFEHVDGTPGDPGAVSRLVYLMGKRRIEMTETIEVRDPPDHYTAIYRGKGVWNRKVNFFERLEGERTLWRVETEFRCRGLMWLMGKLMPGMFCKQTRKAMSDFKHFAETYEKTGGAPVPT